MNGSRLEEMRRAQARLRSACYLKMPSAPDRKNQYAKQNLAIFDEKNADARTLSLYEKATNVTEETIPLKFPVESAKTKAVREENMAQSGGRVA